VHTALTECAAMRTVRGDAVVEPARHHFRISGSAGALAIGQADQLGDGVGVAGQQPHRGSGFALGVVLAQPAARPSEILGGHLRPLRRCRCSS
jgi:hypothetical protein